MASMTTQQLMRQRIEARSEQRIPVEVRPAPTFNPLIRQVAFGIEVKEAK